MKTDAIIYVEVPHQGNPKDFTFDNKEAFLQFLRCHTPDGFSFQKFTRPEFEEAKSEENTGHEIGSPWWNKWVKPGMDLFDQGADSIAEIWLDEVSQEFLYNPTDSEEFDALFDAVDDFHTHYYLTHDQAIQILSKGPSAVGHTHRQGEAYRAIVKAADNLGWQREDTEDPTA
jgi:hypothetical protein